jgi:triosephosphate isomerase
MLAAVDQLAKSTTAVMHRVAILESEVSSLRKANEALSKRRRAKRTRVQLGGSIAVQDAKDQLAQKAGVGEAAQDKEQDGGGAGGGSYEGSVLWCVR